MNLFLDYTFCLQIHTNQKKCSKCGKILLNMAALRTHMTYVHNSGNLPCEFCGKMISKGGLKAHLKIHAKNEATLSCTKCDKKFFWNFQLKRHLESHLVNRVPRHVCKHCGAAFISNFGLFNHVAKTHRPTLHTCEFCDKTFHRNDYYRNHMNSHYGIKNKSKKKYTEVYRLKKITCEICKKEVRYERRKLHMDSHNSVKKFKCQYCEISFTTKNNLERHEQKVHGGKLKYRCNICWSKFLTENDRNVHKCSGKGKKCVCETCGKSFARKHLLTKHCQQEHTPEEENEEEMA